jgi:hypothetical protein
MKFIAKKIPKKSPGVSGALKYSGKTAKGE